MVKRINTLLYTNNNKIARRAKSLKADAESSTADLASYGFFVCTGRVFETRISLWFATQFFQ